MAKMLSAIKVAFELRIICNMYSGVSDKGHNRKNLSIKDTL